MQLWLVEGNDKGAVFAVPFIFVMLMLCLFKFAVYKMNYYKEYIMRITCYLRRRQKFFLNMILKCFII